MEIQNVILHSVEKDEGDSEGRIILREQENEKSEKMNNLSSEILTLFRSSGMRYGKFHDATNRGTRSGFENILKKYYKGNKIDDFVELSSRLTTLFKTKLDKKPSSKGGILWFNFYKYNKEFYFTIVLLRNKKAFQVNNLSIDEIKQLDLDKLHMAARINLTKWLMEEEERYIAFRVGKGARDVTNYFSEFLGCEEMSRPAIDTDNLIDVCKEYCKKMDFTKEQRNRFNNFVFDRITSWSSDSSDISLKDLSEAINLEFPSEDKDMFIKIVNEKSLNDIISIKSTILNKLKRFYGKNNFMSIIIDRDAMGKQDKIEYDKDKDTLTIYDIPTELKEQILSATEE